MIPLVPATDLAINLGPFTAEDTARAESLLQEASDLAREIGLASWTEAEGAHPAPVSVRLAVKRAATRAFNEDPDGFSQEALGDWSGRKSTSALDEIGVFFTTAEIRTISRAGGRISGAYTVRTPSAYVSEIGSTLYVPVEGHSPVPFLDVTT